MPAPEEIEPKTTRPSKGNLAAAMSTDTPLPFMAQRGDEAALVRDEAASRRWALQWMLAIVALAAILAHGIGVTNGYIWDDDHYVTDNATLRDVEGLRRIWLEPTSVPQYYPLVHTSFWLTWQAFGATPWPYHLTNILLHALSAVLLVLLVRRLLEPLPELAALEPEKVRERSKRWRGATAFFAGLLFAIHPVHVESVAWITERKNVLSAVFYLLAALAWMRMMRWPLPSKMLAERAQKPAVRPETREYQAWQSGFSWPSTIGWYALATGLFVAALLSKTVTCSLPAVLLLVLWWRTPGKWMFPQFLAVASLVPWLLIGLQFARVTARMEREHVGAMGAEWDFSLIERGLIAGQSLWMYLLKLLWPEPLAFFYTRWTPDDRVATQYLYPIAFAVLLLAAWALRRRLGRGPLVALLCFAGTLVPALGFFNVYPHRYSFVADHFNYLGSVPILILAAAALARLWLWIDRPAPEPAQQRMARPSDVLYLLPLLVVGLLIAQSVRQTRVYESEETLWLDTIAKTPTAWIAWNNLGEVYRRQDKPSVAMPYLVQAVKLKPDHARAHNNLAMCFDELGHDKDALLHFRTSLQLEPSAQVMLNLGHFYARRGNYQQAAVVYTTITGMAPHWPEGWIALGNCLIDAGEPASALETLEPLGATLNLRVGSDSANRLQGVINRARDALASDPAPSATSRLPLPPREAPAPEPAPEP